MNDAVSLNWVLWCEKYDLTGPRTDWAAYTDCNVHCPASMTSGLLAYHATMLLLCLQNGLLQLISCCLSCINAYARVQDY